MARPSSSEVNLRVVVRMAPEVYVRLREAARAQRSTIGRLCVEAALQQLDGPAPQLPGAAE